MRLQPLRLPGLPVAIALGAVLLAAPLTVAAAAQPVRTEFLNSGKVLTGDLPFSEAVRHGDTLYLSGQIGIEPGTLKLVAGGMRAEAKQALENIRAVLAAHGRTTSDLLKCTVMLADMADCPAFNEVWRAFLTKPYPARSALGASGLALGARVEVECIASAGR
jgi:2-iminobutanoate/2-iminopropanoate deaminase